MSAAGPSGSNVPSFDGVDSNAGNITERILIDREKFLRDIIYFAPNRGQAKKRLLFLVLRKDQGKATKHGHLVFVPVLEFETDDERDAFVNSYDPNKVEGGTIRFEECEFLKPCILEDTMRDRQPDSVRSLVDDEELAIVEKKRRDHGEMAQKMAALRLANATIDPAALPQDRGNGEHDPQTVLELREGLAREIVENRIMASTDYARTPVYREDAAFFQARRAALGVRPPPRATEERISFDEISTASVSVELK